MPVPGRQLLRGPPAVAMDVFLGDGAHRMPRDKTASSVGPRFPPSRNRLSHFLVSLARHHRSAARAVCLGDVSRRYLSPRMREFTQRERRYEILHSKRNLMTPRARKVKENAPATRSAVFPLEYGRYVANVFLQSLKQKKKKWCGNGPLYMTMCTKNNAS